MAAYSVLRVGDTPDRDEPLIETQRRIFKDCPDLVTELLPAVFAPKHLPGFDLADPFPAAMRANDLSIRPLHLGH